MIKPLLILLALGGAYYYTQSKNKDKDKPIDDTSPIKPIVPTKTKKKPSVNDTVQKAGKAAGAIFNIFKDAKNKRDEKYVSKMRSDVIDWAEDNKADLLPAINDMDPYKDIPHIWDYIFNYKTKGKQPEPSSTLAKNLLAIAKKYNVNINSI